jgi:hypothetical protein
MVYIVSFHASLFLSYWAWYVLLHFLIQWFIITGHGLCCFTSCFNSSSLLGKVSIASLSSLVHPYWTWFVLFHFHHWFILTDIVLASKGNPVKREVK